MDSVLIGNGVNQCAVRSPRRCPGIQIDSETGFQNVLGDALRQAGPGLIVVMEDDDRLK